MVCCLSQKKNHRIFIEYLRFFKVVEIFLVHCFLDMKSPTVVTRSNIWTTSAWTWTFFTARQVWSMFLFILIIEPSFFWSAIVWAGKPSLFTWWLIILKVNLWLFIKLLKQRGPILALIGLCLLFSDKKGGNFVVLCTKKAKITTFNYRHNPQACWSQARLGVCFGSDTDCG